MVRLSVFGVIMFVFYSAGVISQYSSYSGSYQDETFAVGTCPTELPETWTVSDTTSATSLAEAVNCSGGIFNVTWRGSVLVNRTIYIPDGTTLNVVGEGSGAEINGGGKIRLFEALGANLEINGLILSNGNAIYGGALYVSSSIVSWHGETSFINNTADNGGALYVTSSTVSWDGVTSFVNNTADNCGGALRAYSDSTVSWDGVTSFVNNTADNCGGAFCASSDSTVSWDGVTSFVNNTADNYGGAFYASLDSTVSWDGETSFVNNTADNYGGAFYASLDSTVSWDGETSFDDNTADFYGGAFYASSDSTVSWDGETSFVNNTADNYGGAFYASLDSTVSWDGVTSFVNNTADNCGGAFCASSDSTVSWDGETSFVNNTAQYGGAFCASSDSTVSWDGETSFVNNTADNYGGAFYACSDSTVSWDGETSFVNNTADNYGGAFYASLDSTVSWDGETSFDDNTADYYGGAFYASSDSTVSWDGETSFVNNTAQYGGAFCASSDSTVSWDGETSFDDNTAQYGGAFYASSDSTVSWDGETSFVNNTAQYGGALYVTSSFVSWHGETSFVNNTAVEYGGALRGNRDSIVSWDGVTSFLDNRAHYGGALAVYDNSIVLSWTGETSFTANNAISSGGAIYASISCNITVKGDTHFLDNKVVIDGGAVHVSDDATSSYFMVDNHSAVFFQGNTCGGNGGAVAIIGGVVTRFPPNVTFLGNTAGVAGGAIYLSGVTVGIRFEGTRFILNSAVIGGGLYTTRSGTGGTEDGYETSEQNPTTFIGCEFIGNQAKRTGGAMDSGEGSDMIVNTYFAQNTAIIGGALSLVGTSSLIGCEFVENTAYENEGPAISNDGAITNFSSCIFADNVFNCEPGYYLEFNHTDALLDAVCKGCYIECTECEIKGKQPTKCVEALQHSSAIGVNATLDSLLIDPGYWRATNTSIRIFECYNPDACLGGVTGDGGYCLEGYEGPYCSVCSKNHTAGLGFVCNKCSDHAAGGIALAVAMAVVFLLAFVAFLSYMLSGEMGDGDKGLVGRVAYFIPLHSVKIVIVVWQVLTQFSTVANVIFPSVYQRFLDGVNILNFDLSWMLSAGCIIDPDFHDKLLLATLGPLVCMAILGGTYAAAMRRNHASEEAREIVRRKHMSMVLLLTFLVYSSVSSTLFKTFACDDLDDGKDYLRADYRIECDSSKHKALDIYASFMVVMYVVGIPSFYGVLLYKNREALIKNAGREEDQSIKPITDLWRPYSYNRFYYEVIECVRRVLLTGALVFIYPNTAAQIAVALMMATFFMIVNEALAPYTSPWDNWCSRTGHAIIFTSIFLALLLKVDVSGERASSQKVFESVLIVSHACLILVVVVEAIAMIVTWRKEVREDTEPRIRRSLSLSSPGADRVGAILEEDEFPPSYENVEDICRSGENVVA